MESKPDEWKDALDGCIREGLNFKKTNEALVEKLGAKAHVSGAAYQRHKKKITGGKEVDNAIGEIGERQREEKDKPKVQRPPWNKTKQTAADTSKLAALFNKGLFGVLGPKCANQKLREEDIQEINPGGAVVATITYFVPGAPLDHPLITLATRAILVYLAFKRICSKIEDVKAKIVSIGGKGDGIDTSFGPEVKVGK